MPEGGALHRGETPCTEWSLAAAAPWLMDGFSCGEASVQKDGEAKDETDVMGQPQHAGGPIYVIK